MQPRGIFRHRKHVARTREVASETRFHWSCCVGSRPRQLRLFISSPLNPILAGEPLTIRLDGLPADKNVTLTAERTIEAPNRAGVPGALSLASGFLGAAGIARPGDSEAALGQLHRCRHSRSVLVDGAGRRRRGRRIEATAGQAHCGSRRSRACVHDDRVHRFAARSESRAGQGIPRRGVRHVARSARRPAIILLGGSEGGAAGRARWLTALRVARIRRARASLLLAGRQASARFPSCRLRSRIFPSIDSMQRSSG